MVVSKIKQKLKNNIVQKIIKKIFNFYNKLETIYPVKLSIKSTDKILILAPHADDESIGCGGLLLNHSSQCDVICLTDGRHGDKDIEPSKMIEIRKKEFESVMTKLQVNNFKLLGIEDTKLESNYDVFKDIKFNAYDYICIPNNLDQHPDHKAVWKHMKRANKEKLIKTDRKIIMYEIWGALPIINYYVDISNEIEKKKEIINMYHSQVKFIDYASRINGLNHYRGMIANKECIEGYFMMKIKELM